MSGLCNPKLESLGFNLLFMAEGLVLKGGGGGGCFAATPTWSGCGLLGCWYGSLLTTKFLGTMGCPSTLLLLTDMEPLVDFSLVPVVETEVSSTFSS